jgi:hypothetical protein
MIHRAELSCVVILSHALLVIELFAVCSRLRMAATVHISIVKMSFDLLLARSSGIRIIGP